MQLSDRVVLVTGATGPLGRALVGAFAAEGCRLGLVGTDHERLAGVASELGLDGARWASGVGDLRRADDTRAAVAAVEARFERVDALLHVVGGYVDGTAVVELDPAEMTAMLDQHVWTTLHTIRAVLPGMIARGWGRIIAVSSALAANPMARMAPYAVAKAAEETLIRCVAREVAGTGVTANVVAVRKIDADHERDSAPSSRNKGWATQEEVAAVMLQLCSDDAEPINGARILLEGHA